jgi:hypothetical protein
MCGGTDEERGAMKNGSKSESDLQELALELDRLRELNSEELREQWQTLFSADPPPKLRSSLIVQGIAPNDPQKTIRPDPEPWSR